MKISHYFLIIFAFSIVLFITLSLYSTKQQLNSTLRKVSLLQGKKKTLKNKITELNLRIEGILREKAELSKISQLKPEVLTSCTSHLQETTSLHKNCQKQSSLCDKSLLECQASKKSLNSELTSWRSKTAIIETPSCQKDLDYFKNRLIDYHRDMYLARDAILSVYKAQSTLFPGVTLITNCPDPDGDRGVEPLAVLQQNLLNPFIEKILLFNNHKHVNISKNFFINSHKIQIVQIPHRFSVGQALEYANVNFDKKIVFVANMDIYFDNTLINLLDMKEKEFYSLSRQRTIEGDNILMDTTKQETIFNNMCIDYMSAHDVFGGVTPFPVNVVNDMKPATLGDRGIDNKINWHFYKAGWKMRNPCSEILVHHLHGKRNLGKDHHKKTWSNFDIYLYPETHKYEKVSEKKWLKTYKEYSWYPAQSPWIKEREAVLFKDE